MELDKLKNYERERERKMSQFLLIFISFHPLSKFMVLLTASHFDISSNRVESDKFQLEFRYKREK